MVSRKFGRMFLTALIGLVVGYLVLVGFAYFRQEKMLYFPLKTLEATPADVGLTFEEVSLRTSDGVDISAWYLPAYSEKGVVLFCHGNAGNISHRLDSLKIFHDLGLSVLIFDYRGYGESGGAPTEEGTYLDGEAAWNYLVDTRKILPGKIVLFGRSLGSAVAAELALRHKAGALIMESGFTSVPDLGQKIFPHLPVKLISRYHYASIHKVGRIRVPKLFVHSPDDEIIPFDHGMALYREAIEPKEFLRISGNHNEGFILSGSVYTGGLRSFIEKYL
jgi:fermentation-respiration switch protein FrsA (DUF1100 family)